MPSKHFKLQQVLNYRVEIEKVRTIEFVAARRDFEHATVKLQHEEEQMQEFTQEYSNCLHKFDNIEDLQMYATYFIRKRNDLKNQQDQVSELGGIMNRQRSSLLDASREKKVLETLKEKKAREFRLMMDQKEQLFMDEISIQKKGN